MNQINIRRYHNFDYIHIMELNSKYKMNRIVSDSVTTKLDKIIWDNIADIIQIKSARLSLFQKIWNQ